jgi:tetratricopeptide (TPR) repeat protein
MNQNALAENLLAEAVQIRKQTLGREHLDVAASLSKLGSVRVALGRFDEAFDDLRAALNIAKSPGATRGDRPNHKTVAQMQCHLACLYFEKGELLAAQATFQDALQIFRMLWSHRKDQDTATRNALAMQLTDTLCNIGSVQNRRKRFSEAIASFQEALDLQRGLLQSQDDPRIISTLDNLGYSYSKNKEYARAVTCYKSMLRSQVSLSGTFSTECLATFRKRILLYEKLKLPEQALEDTKEVLRLQKSMLPKDHVIVLETKVILEELNQKKHKKRKEQEQKSKQAAVAAASA